MALVRENGEKRSDYDIIVENVTRKKAIDAAKSHIKSLGIKFMLGYKFKDGTQQILFPDGYDGSPILGRIQPQTSDSHERHSTGVF